jgi:hypothetical protein
MNAEAFRRSARRRGGDWEVLFVVDMVTPIGFARRDAAERRACGRRNKVDAAVAASNMFAPSELEVHADAGGLDDEVSRTLERI